MGYYLPILVCLKLQLLVGFVDLTFVFAGVVRLVCFRCWFVVCF